MDTTRSNNFRSSPLSSATSPAASAAGSPDGVTTRPLVSPSIEPAALQGLLGTDRWPVVLDVRRTPTFLAASTMLPASRRVAPEEIAAMAASLPRTRPVVCYCVYGHEVGREAVAGLRAQGVDAVLLEGGIDAWGRAGAPLLKKSARAPIPASGGSHWVTRARPKIDRIACPWLVRRFIDPSARFTYVAADQVLAYAQANDAVAFDIAGGAISHDGELCSFDVLLREFGLQDAALSTLATIVRGADTDRLELAPQSAGLLAASLGLSHLFADDNAMLEQGMVLYDALYAWCRFGQTERHTWTTRAGA